MSLLCEKSLNISIIFFFYLSIPASGCSLTPRGGLHSTTERALAVKAADRYAR